MKANSFELINGTRILHIAVPHTRVVHCGLILATGSRHETAPENGIAHFIEHMVFKGTQRRKTYHILNYLESVGGDLNAYTTKEKTVLYASIRSEYLQRAIELLSDIAFHSTFPEKEIAKEKQVIAEEIDMYRDAPEEAIFEDFDGILFPDHPMGRPILGTRETLQTFNQAQLFEYTRRNYAGTRTVLSVVGNVSFEKVVHWAKKYLSDLPAGSKLPPNEPIPAYQKVSKTDETTGQQAHIILGNRAYPRRQGLFVPFYLLNNYLGGPANNTLLNLNIREKYGLTYSIYSSYSPYVDTGAWTAYFACEPRYINRIRDLTLRELRQLRNQRISDLKLSRIKTQLVGQMTINDEQALGQMLAMGKNFLDFGQHFTLEEMVSDLEKVTSSQVLEAANEVFAEDQISTLIFLPEE
ncbi:MAG: insulinase family protein [Bacteroidia bacterium]|nr:insulinase family protein [Bacteroidia bacterium]